MSIKTPEFVDPAQNSEAREAMNGFSHQVASGIHEMGFTANQVTLVGTAMVVLAARATAKNNMPPALRVILFTLGSLLDGVDGKVAEMEGDKKKLVDGDLIDSSADRVQELATFLSLAERSARDGHTPSMLVYLGAAASSSWPSVMRARAEANDTVVPENDLLGTRLWRAVLAGNGIGFAGVPHVPLAVGTTVTANNALVAWKRYKAVDKSQPTNDTILSQEKIQKGKWRNKLSIFVAAGAGASAVAAGLTLRNSKK